MVRNLIFTVLVLVIAQARKFLDPVVSVNKEENLLNPWEVKSFSVKLDHFTYSDTRMFAMKWLWNNTFYKPGGPIFFYTGNEGSIEGFAIATGMMWDLAPMFSAALIFAEHRFYGETLPFGNMSFANINNLGYLTSEQALADFAALIHELKTSNNTFNYSYPKNTPVIAFGGSYGGMLSAWFRMKYPHLVNGAWASSAPITYFRGSEVDPGAFDAITTRTFVDAGCNRNIVESSWNAIINLSSTESGRQFLNTQFLIDPKSTINSTDRGWMLNYYLREAFEYIAMVNYPYKSSFLMSLPAWPVKVACSFMNASNNNFTDEELATMINDAANVYYNTTGTLKFNCIDPTVCGDPATSSIGVGIAWPWQECSEIVVDMCSKGGQNDFFWEECKSNPIDVLVKTCQQIFKSFKWSTANWNIDAVSTLYGLTLDSASNIILTQGHLDPWSGGGHTASSTKNHNQYGIYVLEIPGSAHHLDLRTPNTCDPNTIRNARYQIVQILKCWVRSCYKHIEMKELPALEVPPMGEQCEDVIQGYPWGQSASSSLLLYLVAVFSLLSQHLAF